MHGYISDRPSPRSADVVELDQITDPPLSGVSRPLRGVDE